MQTLRIERQIKTEKSSIGRWFLNDNLLDLWSLEDKDRFPIASSSGKIYTLKVKDETAINIGTYPLIVDKSDRWSKKYGYDFYMLHILNVVGFSGIRIHWGNTDIDTDGCILVGKSKVINKIVDSRNAYKELLNILAPIMGFEVGFDKKNNIATIILPKDYKQKESINLIVSRSYEV